MAESKIKKADDWMRGSYLQRQIDLAQQKTGRKGVDTTFFQKDAKVKSEPKKIKKAPAPKAAKPTPSVDTKGAFPVGKDGVQLQPGDVVTYVNAKGTPRKAIVNAMLQTVDDDGDAQIQLKLKGATYAVDRKSINSANGKKWTYDPTTGKGTSETIKEGGNIWPDETEDFDHAIIGDMMKQINSVVSKTGAKALPMGSGATPTPGKRSGDLDMILDAGKLMDFFKVKDAKGARVELEKLFQQAGFDTKKSGTSVHVKTKVGGSAQQVDIMVVDNGETAQKFHVHDIPKGSPYKGVHKQILIADLAKNAKTNEHPEGFKWSAYKGLLDRRDDALVSSDLDEIAKILLGPNAGAKDLGSVEAMMKANPEAKQYVDAQEADPASAWNKSKVQPKESLADKNYNRVVELMKALTK